MATKWKILTFVCCLIALQLLFVGHWASNLGDLGWIRSDTGSSSHTATYISASDYEMLASLTNKTEMRNSISHICKKRLPESAEHAEVKRYIADTLINLGWKVTFDEFTTKTPVGDKRYTNIVASLHPNVNNKLMFAAHYETKHFPEPSKYVGATDAAASVAILLDIAKTMTRPMIDRTPSLDVVLVFFDGEEAWGEWTEEDSIYGAKHLAQVMQDDGLLKSIDMMVLLDLIGTRETQFFSHFGSTSKQFKRMFRVEERLRTSKLLLSDSIKLFNTGYPPHSANDDHIPFLRRGIPILHLITIPFPSVWHTEADTMDVIDMDVVCDVATILRCFIAEYLW